MVAGTDDVGGGAPPGKGQPGKDLQREPGVLDCVLLSVGGMVWLGGARGDRGPLRPPLSHAAECHPPRRGVSQLPWMASMTIALATTASFGTSPASWISIS